MWANGLHYVTEEGITVGEVQRRARTHTNLDGIRRWGYVTVDGRRATAGGAARGRIGARAPDELSLWSLLSRALLAFALDYEHGATPSLAVMADVLRVRSRTDVRLADLPRISGVSKEAIAMACTLLEEGHLVHVRSENRRRLARLTDRGANARTRGLKRIADVEAAWRAVRSRRG